MKTKAKKGSDPPPKTLSTQRKKTSNKLQPRVKMFQIDEELQLTPFLSKQNIDPNKKKKYNSSKKENLKNSSNKKTIEEDRCLNHNKLAEYFAERGDQSIRCCNFCALRLSSNGYNIFAKTKVTQSFQQSPTSQLLIKRKTIKGLSDNINSAKQEITMFNDYLVIKKQQVMNTYKNQLETLEKYYEQIIQMVRQKQADSRTHIVNIIRGVIDEFQTIQSKQQKNVQKISQFALKSESLLEDIERVTFQSIQQVQTNFNFLKKNLNIEYEISAPKLLIGDLVDRLQQFKVRLQDFVIQFNYHKENDSLHCSQDLASLNPNRPKNMYFSFQGGGDRYRQRQDPEESPEFREV